MKRNLKIFMAVALIAFVPAMVSCGTDEPSSGVESDSEPTSPVSKEVSPQVKIISSAATKDDFTVSFRVKSVSKPSVTLHWSSHSSKTSNPSLGSHSSVTRTYDEVSHSNYTWWYYKVTHAGFKPGDYVYFKVSASNSKGDDESSVNYVIIKR